MADRNIATRRVASGLSPRRVGSRNEEVEALFEHLPLFFQVSGFHITQVVEATTDRLELLRCLITDERHL